MWKVYGRLFILSILFITVTLGWSPNTVRTFCERLNLLRRTLTILAASTGRTTLIWALPGHNCSALNFGHQATGSLLSPSQHPFSPWRRTLNPGGAFSVPMIATPNHEFICVELPSHDGHRPGGLASTSRLRRSVSGSSLVRDDWGLGAWFEALSSTVYRHKTFASWKGRRSPGRWGALGPGGSPRLNRVYFSPLDCPLRR